MRLRAMASSTMSGASALSGAPAKEDIMSNLTYGFEAQLDGITVEEAVNRVTEALKDEGFGVLSTIDIQGAFKTKLDKDFPPYVILGACNPQLAWKALQTDPNIGLLLPCNVVVQERSDRSVSVAFVDPGAMFELVPGSSLEPIASEARERLHRALKAVQR